MFLPVCKLQPDVKMLVNILNASLFPISSEGGNCDSRPVPGDGVLSPDITFIFTLTATPYHPRNCRDISPLCVHYIPIQARHLSMSVNATMTLFYLQRIFLPILIK